MSIITALLSIKDPVLIEFYSLILEIKVNLIFSAMSIYSAISRNIFPVYCIFKDRKRNYFFSQSVYSKAQLKKASVDSHLLDITLDFEKVIYVVDKLNQAIRRKMA